MHIPTSSVYELTTYVAEYGSNESTGASKPSARKTASKNSVDS